jgi:hypothetical protein
VNTNNEEILDKGIIAIKDSLSITNVWRMIDKMSDENKCSDINESRIDDCLDDHFKLDINELLKRREERTSARDAKKMAKDKKSEALLTHDILTDKTKTRANTVYFDSN